MKNRVKQLILGVPVLGPVLRRLKGKPRPVESASYWQSRYQHGGNSGPGSYGLLAAYKAEYLNNFVTAHDVQTVIEFGCGDGNQLALTHYPFYIGYDVSPVAIDLCRLRFKSDGSKRFLPMSAYSGEVADLTLSLDVIYHLLEDAVYSHYMGSLFSASTRYVIIYSSNHASTRNHASHVYHRRFTDLVAERFPQWALQEHAPNPHPPCEDLNQGSFADFYVFSKAVHGS